MSDYIKTSWIDNETVVSASNLNKIENQLDLLTQDAILQEEVNINVDNDLNELTDLLNTKMNKVDAKNIQQQINNLVLDAGNPEASSAEIKQARGNYSVLNDRLNSHGINIEEINDIVRIKSNNILNPNIKKLENYDIKYNKSNCTINDFSYTADYTKGAIALEETLKCEPNSTYSSIKKDNSKVGISYICFNSLGEYIKGEFSKDTIETPDDCYDIAVSFVNSENVPDSICKVINNNLAYEAYGYKSTIADNISNINKELKEVDQIKASIKSSKIDYFGEEHSSIVDRLDSDFNNVHQRINNSSYLEFKGTNITANNSYFGLIKDINIKGRTLQNICPNDFTVNFISNGSWLSNFLYQNGSEYNYYRKYTNIPLKPSTVYTIVCNVVKNTCDTKVNLNNYDSNSSLIKENMIIPLNEVGIMKFKGTTIDDFSSLSLQVVLRCQNSGSTTGEIIIKDIMILEGDYTDTSIEDLQYGEGIYSAGENEDNLISIKNYGKNLLDISPFKPYANNVVECSISNQVITLTGKKTADVEAITDSYACGVKVKLEKGKIYSASFKSDCEFGNLPNTDTVEAFLLLNGSSDISDGIINIQGKKEKFTCLISGDYYLRLDVNKGDATHKFWDFQVEEGSVCTEYEPYQEVTQELQLTEPLRSLQNGTYDEILEDGTEIRRVGKIVLDESLDYQVSGWALSELTYAINTVNAINNCVSGSSLISNVLVSYNLNNEDKEGILISGTSRAIFRVLKSKLHDTNNTTIKEYLKANPITVYYELVEPIITKHNKNINLKSFNGTTHITSDNLLKPVISCKVPCDVQAVVTNLIAKNKELTKDISNIQLENEEQKLSYMENSIDADMRLTMLELGVN